MRARLESPRASYATPGFRIGTTRAPSRTTWETAVERAKLDDWHFHDCRHHFASWFMMRGGNLLALSKILGHAKVSMTEKYAHLAPEHLRNEITRTERATPVLEPTLEPSGPASGEASTEVGDATGAG